MREFIVPNRKQQLLFAQIELESIAPVGSALRTIDALVDEFDTRAIEAEYDLESEQGRNPIHPKTLIKVALYALHNCRFSLRKMEHDTAVHLGYRWLTGDEGIDHSTMGKFLVKYKEQIVELFAQVVEIGIEEELINFDVLAVDTVKIRANASYKQFKTLEKMEEERRKIRERLRELLEKAGEESEAERVALEKRKAALAAGVAAIRERIEEKGKGEAAGERKELEKKEKLNLTDPDCGLVQQGNGEINPGYSVTTTVDGGSDFITQVQVNESQSDAAALLEAVEGSEENTGERHETVVADAGFASMDNYEKLEGMEQDSLIPDRRLEVEERGETAKGEYDRSRFRYNKRHDRYTCPGGKRLERKGTVEQDGREYGRYANRRACAECDKRAACTKSAFRVIQRDTNEEVRERMRKKLKQKKNKKRYGMRAHTVESMYGQIKQNLKYRMFMRRGKPKVLMEATLLCMLHNIMKIGAARMRALMA
jgi:transposase